MRDPIIMNRIVFVILDDVNDADADVDVDDLRFTPPVGLDVFITLTPPT